MKQTKDSMKTRQSTSLGLVVWLCLFAVESMANPSLKYADMPDFDRRVGGAAAAPKQVLHGHVPAAVSRLQPLGDLAGTNRLKLAIGLPLRNQAALSNLLHQIYDPASPNYHHYLTPEQFAEQFGPTKQDYEAVIAFAKAHGLSVTTTYPNRVLVDVNGSVADIERAMHIKMRVYQHPTEQRTFHAPDTEPSLDLAVPVLRVIGLDNYELPHPLFKVRPLAEQGKFTANGSGPSGNYMGYDFRQAYAPGVSLNGAGQTVALFEMDGYYPSDIVYYENINGLPNVTLTNALLGGATGVPSDPNAVVEAPLDIEMAISMAPQLSQVMVYEAPLTSVGAYDISESDGDRRSSQTNLLFTWVIDRIVSSPVPNQIYLQYAAQGQSFFQVSGDEDAYVSGTFQTADNPYIITVGGTTLTTTGPGGAYVSETVWQWGGGTPAAAEASVPALPYRPINKAST